MRESTPSRSSKSSRRRPMSRPSDLMKLQFKIQPYQTEAVDSVVDVFAGQPRRSGVSYRIDPGKVRPSAAPTLFETSTHPDWGLRNAEIELSVTQLLANLHQVQKSRNL